MNDYKMGNVLGEGSYSTVVKATNIKNGNVVAVKILSKQHMIRQKKTKYVLLEKEALTRCNPHSFIVSLFSTHQDSQSLYFVVEFCGNHDLLYHLNAQKTLDTSITIRPLACQIVSAISFLHSQHIIHRDIKPENILLTSSRNHIRLCDFGSVKLVDSEKDTNSETSTQDKRSSFVGTAEYTPPELLDNRTCCYKSDVWALGCVLFQLCYGRTPFKGKSEYLVFKRICDGSYVYPKCALDFDISRLSLNEPPLPCTVPFVDITTEPTILGDSDSYKDNFDTLLVTTDTTDSITHVGGSLPSIPKTFVSSLHDLHSTVNSPVSTPTSLHNSNEHRSTLDAVSTSSSLRKHRSILNSLIDACLITNTSNRICTHDIMTKCDFFKNVNWETLQEYDIEIVKGCDFVFEAEADIVWDEVNDDEESDDDGE